MHSILAATAARAIDLACQNKSPVFAPAVRGLPSRDQKQTRFIKESVIRQERWPAVVTRTQCRVSGPNPVDVKSNGVHQYVLARSCLMELPVDATRPVFNFAGYESCCG